MPTRLDRRTLLTHVCGIECVARKSLVARCRNAMAPQEFLGVRFGTFESGARCARAEAFEPAALKFIDDAGDQRRFGPDDREIDAFRFRE